MNLDYILHGIVSALFERDSIKIIEIDGSINSDNSGGPLLDMNDEVIGILTQKAGKVDDSLMAVADRYFREWGRVGVTEPSLYGEDSINLPHPKKTLAELVKIIRYYTNVGIGYAYSIQYTKKALGKFL